MFKKTIPVAVAVVLSLSAGAVAADQILPRSNDKAMKSEVSADGWRYVGGETGWELVPHAYEFRNGKLVHIDKIEYSTPKPTVASVEQARNSVTSDGWRHVGDETEWSPVPYAYEFRGGKLVHADSFDHNTPKPILASTEQERHEVTADGWRHVGGEIEWALVQHSYEFRQGKLVHAADCIYGAPKTSQSKTL